MRPSADNRNEMRHLVRLQSKNRRKMPGEGAEVRVWESRETMKNGSGSEPESKGHSRGDLQGESRDDSRLADLHPSDVNRFWEGQNLK